MVWGVRAGPLRGLELYCVAEVLGVGDMEEERYFGRCVISFHSSISTYARLQPNCGRAKVSSFYGRSPVAPWHRECIGSLPTYVGGIAAGERGWTVLPKQVIVRQSQLATRHS